MRQNRMNMIQTVVINEIIIKRKVWWVYLIKM
jgi:hypothetical protein